MTKVYTDEQRAKWKRYRQRAYDKTGPTVKECYTRTKRNAETRGIVFDLTLEQFAQIVAQPCVYGAATFPGPAIVPRTGIDRMDNALGYVPGNCAPCCDRHNRVKSDVFTYAEMMDIAARYNVQCGPAKTGRKKHARIADVASIAAQ